MKINKNTKVAIADKFESALDYIVALDKVPFNIKREAAAHAAREAVEYLKERLS